jgi:hypothetical protein
MTSRFRPAPATVLAALALFISLGGTSYAVSTQISGAKLKNRSVAGTKLEKHTVTGTDVKISTFPKVPVAHYADDSTNATNAVNAINATQAGTLTGTIGGGQVVGAVADATNATTATTATTATSATYASNVGGHTFAQINATAGTGNAATLLAGFGGLTLSCTGPSGTAGEVMLTVTNSLPQGGVIGASSVDESETAHADEETVAGANGGIPQSTNLSFPVSGSAQMSFAYKTVIGNTADVVSGTFTVIQDNGCTAFGNADASSVSG